MMQPNELRIGNWVEKTEVKFSGLKKENYQIKNAMGIVHAGSYNPIPLTEDWLKRFGFENEHKNAWWIFRRHSFEFHVNLVTGNALINDKDSTCSLPLPIEYVHQLQNLIFALTNEELTLKETE